MTMRLSRTWIGLCSLAAAGLLACGDDGVSPDEDAGKDGGTGRMRADGGAGSGGSSKDSGAQAGGGATDGGDGAVAGAGGVDAMVAEITQMTLDALAELSPAELPAPPPDISNKYGDDPAAAALGKQFFFDPGFSGKLLDPDNKGNSTSLGTMGESGKVSCAGCHLPEVGFLDTRSVRQTVSLAAAWGKRKTPSLLDVGHNKIIMWDGRHDALFNQPFGALESGVEMNSSRLYAAQQIYERYRAAYEAVFGPIEVPLDDADRFPQMDGSTTGCRGLSATTTGIFTGIDCHGVPGDGAEFDGLSVEDQDAVTRIWANAGKAIAAFERQLSCGPSRFDRWMHGDEDALTESEQRGAALFVGQRHDGSRFTGCNDCHSGPFMSDGKFHNVGLKPTGVGPAGTFIDIDDKGAFDGLTEALKDPLNVKGKFSDGDDGRLPETVDSAMMGAFRTPMLRCVNMRPSMMHTGQFRDVAKVVTFFNVGGLPEGYEGTSEIAPLNLTRAEEADLVAFLKALTGPGPSAELMAVPELPP